MDFGRLDQLDGSDPIFFLDRDWWAWSGWTSVAAIAQGLVAFGTVAGRPRPPR